MINYSRFARYNKSQTDVPLTDDSKFYQMGNIISTMRNLFVSEKLVDDTSASVDSTMLKASGPIWHKSDMKNNRLPIAGIDTDAKWGFSNSKGLGIWV